MSHPPSDAAPLISIEAVDKWYGAFQVLRGITLTVRKGEKIVLCGPSGSGKSTLIRYRGHGLTLLCRKWRQNGVAMP